ncbi:MAG: hypothetical protein U9N52_10395 [Campylobacterota bacterium]|nr:hypothetical protein [Campylobacterota bacterium]
MSFSLDVDGEPDFSLFSMSRDLRNYLNKKYGVPQEAIYHVFLSGDRIDFSLKEEPNEREKNSHWYRRLTTLAS